MSVTDRDPLDSTVLTLPAATRSFTSADESPRTGDSIVTSPAQPSPLPAVVLVVVAHGGGNDTDRMGVTVDLGYPNLILFTRHGLVREEVVLKPSNEGARDVTDVTTTLAFACLAAASAILSLLVR